MELLSRARQSSWLRRTGTSPPCSQTSLCTFSGMVHGCSFPGILTIEMILFHQQTGASHSEVLTSESRFNCIEVIITSRGDNPMSMVAPDEVNQSCHIAYFRFLYRAICSFLHFVVEFLRIYESWSTEYWSSFCTDEQVHEYPPTRWSPTSIIWSKINAKLAEEPYRTPTVHDPNKLSSRVPSRWQAGFGKDSIL